MGKSFSKNLAELNRTQGNKIYAKGEYDKAIKLYSLAIWLVPNEIEYYGNRISCYMMLKDYKNALIDLNYTIKLNDKFEKSYFRMIKCALALGDIPVTEYAIKCYKNLIKNSSNDITEYEQNVLKLKDLLISIQTQFLNKNYKNCLNDLEKSLFISPEFLLLKYQKVECLIFLNKFEEAKEIIEKSLYILEPNSIEVLYLSILYSYHIGDLSKCISECERNVKLIQDHMKINILYNEAKLIFDKNTLAVTLLNNEKNIEAITVYTSAIEYEILSHPIQSKLYFNRASVYFKIYSYYSAIRDCEKALNLSPKQLHILYLSAKCYFKINLFEKCVELCESAIQIGIPEENLRHLLAQAKLEICKKDERKRRAEVEEAKRRRDEKRKIDEERRKVEEMKREEDRRKQEERYRQEQRSKEEERKRQNERRKAEERKREQERMKEKAKRDEEERTRQEEEKKQQNKSEQEREQRDKEEPRRQQRREAKKRQRQRNRNKKRQHEQEQREQQEQRKQEQEKPHGQEKRQQEEQKQQQQQRQRYQQDTKYNSNSNSRTSDTKGYYKIMNLNRNATQEEIQFAYKALAKKHHPDKHLNSYAKQENQEIFKCITEAYRILSDSIKKYDYDRL